MSELAHTPPPPPRPRKAPGLAAFFSLLPGLGHVYLGMLQRGVAFLAAFLGSIWLADHADLSGVVVAFVFFYGMIDAYQLASSPPGEPSPATPTAARRAGNLAVGLVLVLFGSLALYNNFYPLDLSFLADWWPLALIVFGLWLLFADLRSRKQTPPPEAS